MYKRSLKVSLSTLIIIPTFDHVQKQLNHKDFTQESHHAMEEKKTLQEYCNVNPTQHNLSSLRAFLRPRCSLVRVHCNQIAAVCRAAPLSRDTARTVNFCPPIKSCLDLMFEVIKVSFYFLNHLQGNRVSFDPLLVTLFQFQLDALHYI